MPLFEGLSLGGEKNAVIIDFGDAYTKCGFSGENAPRCIIPSEIKRATTDKIVKLHSVAQSEELYSCLVDFIHILYFRHLLVNPKERRVVVVESILNTTMVRETIAKVLFKHYEVPSVLFAPGHLVSLFTLGITTGLVLDCGYSETLALPVYDGIPIIKAWEAIPLAGKAIHNYLEAQLLESATVRTQQQTAERPLSAVLGAISEHLLEDIKVRCCFVTRIDRAKKMFSVKTGRAETSELPEPPPGVDYPLDGGKIMHIGGKIRENTCEVLFEIDNEERSVATLLLDAIIKSPIDMRKELSENIVIAGGTALLPGFKHRLLAEMKELMEKEKYRNALAVKTFKFHQIPGQENYVFWLGGAIFGALEVLGNRSVSRESYQQNGVLPDWSSLLEMEEKDERGLVVKR